ncbi:hypothetical protein ATM97_21795 [Nocardia sp. MH4]|nr:hypothetical protein [Nocardia sp. MH4]
MAIQEGLPTLFALFPGRAQSNGESRTPRDRRRKHAMLGYQIHQILHAMMMLMHEWGVFPPMEPM